MGRLKFLVKDFRSEITEANIDNEKEDSPVKNTFRETTEINEDYAEEEEVEIECGVADND